MPASPGQEPGDKMFLENANVRHHEFFLRARPYRGEPPTVAGSLLYPDAPAKMETTSREAFCCRAAPQTQRAEGRLITKMSQQESHLSHPTSSTQTGRGNTSRGREPVEENPGGDRPQTHNGRAMQTQYQKDFPPPSSCLRRRTPALPQPDNIGINPAFGIEFGTVQRETYPVWPILTPGRLRAAFRRQRKAASEY